MIIGFFKMEVIDNFVKNDFSIGDDIEVWLGRIELRLGRRDVEILSEDVKEFFKKCNLCF